MPSLLGISPEDFKSNGLKFQGNPLPEFASISRNILDCFATAVLAVPFIKIPAAQTVFTCRLQEDNGNLTLYLTVMPGPNDQDLALQLTTDGEVCIATYLRRLSATKNISVGNVYWDSVDKHSLFFLEYPGKLVRAKVPGLGDPDENGKARWPEVRLEVAEVTAALRNEARNAITFVSQGGSRSRTVGLDMGFRTPRR